MPKLGKYNIQLDDILDLSIRDSLKNMVSYMNENPILKGDWRFFTYKAKAAGTFTVPHSLGYQPLDVLRLAVSAPDTALVTWQYDKFNVDTVTLTTNGPCTLRAFIGRYKE